LFPSKRASKASSSSNLFCFVLHKEKSKVRKEVEES
jgi:hypothetical protein